MSINKLTEEEKAKICPEEERANISSKEFWYKKYLYCLDSCTKCTEIDLLKKIYWELRKLNEFK